MSGKISTKNARIIRRGVEAGKDVVIRGKAGLPVQLETYVSALERKAYMHQLHSELGRAVRRIAKHMHQQMLDEADEADETLQRNKLIVRAALKGSHVASKALKTALMGDDFAEMNRAIGSILDEQVKKESKP